MTSDNLSEVGRRHLDSQRYVETQKSLASLHRLHNGSRPLIDANQFISRVGLIPFGAGCGLSKPCQSKPLTVFSSQGRPLAQVPAWQRNCITKEEGVAPRQGGVCSPASSAQRVHTQGGGGSSDGARLNEPSYRYCGHVRDSGVRGVPVPALDGRR